jgi:hypothetical protein
MNVYTVKLVNGSLVREGPYLVIHYTLSGKFMGMGHYKTPGEILTTTIVPSGERLTVHGGKPGDRDGPNGSPYLVAEPKGRYVWVSVKLMGPGQPSRTKRWKSPDELLKAGFSLFTDFDGNFTA